MRELELLDMLAHNQS